MPRHRLETLAADPDPSHATEARHIAACELCASRLAEIGRSRAAYLAAYPAEAFGRQVAARAERPALIGGSRKSGLARLCGRRSSIMNGGITKIVLSGLMAVLAGGCKPDGGPASLTAQQYPAAYARALCAKAYSCCSAADRQSRFGVSEADCLDSREQAAKAALGDFADDIARGYILFDGARAAACFSAITAASCDKVQSADNFTKSIADCQEHLLPKVAPGGACLDDYHCVGGWCDPASGMKCVPRVSDGQPCVKKTQCKEGSSCTTNRVCAPEPARSYCSAG